MDHIIEFNQDIIHCLPDELITDLNQLFKLIYKENYDKLFLRQHINKEEYISYFKNRYFYELSYNEDFFEKQLIIEQLDNSGIIIHFPENEIIIKDEIKSDCIIVNNEDYNYIILTIIMLCVKHKVINNNWLSAIILTDEYILYEYGDLYIDDYYNNLINRCKQTLFKIGYTEFNCVVDKNHYLHLETYKYLDN